MAHPVNHRWRRGGTEQRQSILLTGANGCTELFGGWYDFHGGFAEGRAIVADENQETPDQVIRRIVDAVKEPPRVLSMGEEQALKRAYAQLAADRFAEEAVKLRDTPTFDQDVADLINFVKAELSDRIHIDLDRVSFKAMGPFRDVPGAIMVRIGETLQVERSKLIIQRTTKAQTEPSRPKTRQEWLDRCMAHTETKSHAFQARNMRISRTAYLDLKNHSKASDKTRAKVAAYITNHFMPCDPKDLL